MPKNWKTTALGITGILGAVCHAAEALINGGNVDWAATIATITVGWGLIHAKDAK